MLSRGTSSASQQPRRAKSTPSIRPRSIIPTSPTTNNAETTHQEALTAANLAFERANEREMAKKAPNGQDTTSIANKDAGPRLGRRQSVRFAGPTAIPSRNRSITRREAPGSRTSLNPYESQLQSRSRNIEPSIYSDERASTALAQPIGEFGESDNASVPSSYRRLRKAKSMFSPGKTPSAVFGDGIPYSRRHFHRQSLQSSDAYHEPLQVPDPRLRKSNSFFRGVTDRISTSSRQYVANDAAVQLARDQYLRQLEQQRLKEQPSFLGLGNRRKSQKGFRRTVRTSSTNSYGSAIASPLASVEPPKNKDLGHRARNLSQTIKKKFKRVFKRHPDAEDTIPVQQIKATHPHYGDYISTSDGKEQRYPPVPEPDAELLLRVGSRESVMYTTPNFVDKGARPGSIRSAHSDDDESNGKSRVTSWTDSTAANTINMPQTLERKRLSIIKEDGGPHQPSSSARQYEEGNNGYASFRQPVRQSSAGRVSGPIDPHRIFSALQKKIDENNREAALDDSEPGTDSSSSHHKARLSTRAPRRTSSIRKGAKAKSNSRSGSRGAKQQGFSDLGKGLTQERIAEMNERGIQLPKRPLHEVKSAFFPPSMRIERSNPSPYRRAMHASSETEADSQIRIDFEDRPQLEGPSSAVTGRLRNDSVTGSDSVYSRSSGGDTPKANRSSISLAMSESSGEAGTAIIITGQPGKNERSAHPVVIQHGYSSEASSGNWRNFMATQVASLEDYGTRQEQTYDAHPVKDSGHRREYAQVDSNDVNIGRLQSPTDILKQPLAIIQGNSNLLKASKHKVSRSLDRSPLVNIRHSANAGNVQQNDNAPLSRASENSRKISKVESERRSLSRVHEPSGGLRQKNSHSSLKMQTEQRHSPTTANIRYSPERVERLRRLKSSSGTSLGKWSPRNENQASRHTPPGEKDYDSHSPAPSSDVPQTQAGNNHKLVDSFLKGRRSVMRISEESGTDPAFL
ncbi:hypothetical protein HO133_009714 [Letharia lupina]|uniref:Uncharacterized protein n=1 Tax=Letharia lupina TaxID=560253 RepID=A0A8H6CLM0_9LECA|nr:uncharacterized protein HO133_009714 [Letharia lupina]KAF6225713.1 hypothetical protein HO133_009714 [Letharia lupina]